MKRDQYIPHDVNTRSNSEIMHLIEEQGIAGYGVYWGLMEYLRTQDDYIGKLNVLKPLSRQLKTPLPKLLNVLNNYGLFVCGDYTFHSPKLDEVMKELEESRERFEAFFRQNCVDNSLEISETYDTESNILRKGEGKGIVTSSSAAEEEGETAAEAAVSLPEKYAWEEYVDELDGEEEWKELMAMRSGLKKHFFTLYPRIVRAFKNHVRSIGKESHILSLNDAKHYFCFYITPGSSTFTRLINELKQEKEDNPFRYEYRDPTTGKRMYCGMVIPDDAPPRPCNQAVWIEESKRWFY